MNKRGIEMTVVAIILVLAAFLVVGIFFKNLSDITRENVDRSVCGTAIQLASAGHSITKLDSNIRGKCKTEDKDVNAKEKKEVMEAIAQEMYWCYAHIGQGKLDFSSNFDFWFSKDQCLYCAIIVFGEDTRKLGTIEGSDFKTYLIENPIPGNDKTSYAEYLGLTRYSKDNPTIPVILPDIDLTNNLEIFDFMHKETDKTDYFTFGATAVATGAILYFSGGTVGIITSIGSKVATDLLKTGIIFTLFQRYKDDKQEYAAGWGYARSGEFVGKQCTLLN